MDSADLRYLDSDSKDRYAKLEQVFASEGWKLIVFSASVFRDNAKERAASAQTWEDNRFAQGLRAAYDHIAKLEDNTENEFLAMVDAAKAAAEELKLTEENIYE